jgi:hypothetical protein
MKSFFAVLVVDLLEILADLRRDLLFCPAQACLILRVEEIDVGVGDGLRLDVRQHVLRARATLLRLRGDQLLLDQPVEARLEQVVALLGVVALQRLEFGGGDLLDVRFRDGLAIDDSENAVLARLLRRGEAGREARSAASVSARRAPRPARVEITCMDISSRIGFSGRRSRAATGIPSASASRRRAGARRPGPASGR